MFVTCVVLFFLANGNLTEMTAGEYIFQETMKSLGDGATSASAMNAIDSAATTYINLYNQQFPNVAAKDFLPEPSWPVRFELN